LIVIADSLCILLDGRQGSMAGSILLVTALCGYILQILICFFWFWYAQLVTHDERKMDTRIIVLEAMPAAIAITLTLASVLTGWIFSYDATNTYHRGPLFAVIPALSFGYIAFGYSMVIRFRRKLDRRHLVALLGFPIPPLVGGILQTILYGVSLIWSGTTLSLLIVYIAIQNELLLLDYLTGLNNRVYFDKALKRRINIARPAHPFALVLVDLDSFHSINERFGHLAGDEALKATADILRRYFGKSGFIARFDGDAFAVLYEIQALSELSGMEVRLHDDIDEWNEQAENAGKYR
jgi:diguanylate cyclase (GGDEF)-like protein